MNWHLKTISQLVSAEIDLILLKWLFIRAFRFLYLISVHVILIWLSVSQLMIKKSCRWQDWNPASLVSEVTALSITTDVCHIQCHPLHKSFSQLLSLLWSFFKKKLGQPRPLFIYFRRFKHTLQILQQINVKNVHPVYGVGIGTHNLWNMSLLP